MSTRSSRPTIPAPPAKIGQNTLTVAGVEHNVRIATTRNVRALNLTGLPLLSVPLRLHRSRISPSACKIIGRLWDEAGILEIGHAYEQATDWRLKRPAIADE